MQFLKNFGQPSASTNNAKSTTKNSYFSSLSVSVQKQKPSTEKITESKAPNKDKKRGPPKGFLPQKFALDFNPPCIIMEYRDVENNKLYHHKMKIKKLKKQTSNKEALDYLKKKHYHYFIPKIIDEEQIQKLIAKLKNGLVLGQNKSEIQDVSEEGDFDFDYDDDFED